MNDPETLTETEQLLLMAAAVQGLGPDSDLVHGNTSRTSRIVNQVLRWRGLTEAEIRRDTEGSQNLHPIRTEVYNALIHMTRQKIRGGSWREAERPGPALFEGGGNWGVPGNPDRPACWPEFNSCRLTTDGERIAQELLAGHPECR